MKDTLDLPAGFPPAGLGRMARRILAGWLFLAVGALAVAGALALLLAIARTPHVQDWLPWPWDSFFRKALVAHVVFAFVVWFLAMLGGMAAAVRPGSLTGGGGLLLAVVGAVLMLVPTLANRGEALLVNYVPVLDHPLFLSGLVLLAAGVAVPVIHMLVRPPAWSGPVTIGTGAAGAVYLLSLVCFALAWLRLPGGSPGEPLFWGGGHLLQFVHTALALTAWQVLGERVFGTLPVPRRLWTWLCAGLVAAAATGPLFYALWPADSEDLRRAFTGLYWVGLPAPPLVAAVLLARAIWRGPRNWQSPVFLSLVLSLALFALGGIFGAFADGGDTRTPAHYHAEIGGVNVAFMALFFACLLPALLKSSGAAAPVRLSLLAYGGGQALFCVGMFIAGGAGVGRKVAGAAQGLDSLVKTSGMALTGLGGAIAVLGGVMFVWLALARLAGDHRPRRR
jgi:hypothetical protein